MHAKFVNEGIKYLSGISKKEIVDKIKASSDVELFKLWEHYTEISEKYEGSNSMSYLCYQELCNRETSYALYAIKIIKDSMWHANFRDFIKYGRHNKVNESIKHLAARSTAEIIDNIKESENLYYQMYMGLTNNLEDVVQSVLNKNAIAGKNTEDNPIYLLGSFFLTNEELSFYKSGNWNFDKYGKMFCPTFDNEVDEFCEEFIEFLNNHNITYKRISKPGSFTARVQFSGNAKDIILLVFTYFISHYQKYEYMLDEAYEIIFTG